ncbi:hypothetical protein FGO68_gene10259 [Halteria grandinella]|uniref:F5/8 type C domain-containing protein n=1 Tax=Halteria grandinella TaxID=5974 RepID=A0A8J8SZ74_HALGN|nr:hypothetical protein FGO68_gene10259 [Halteria grandinella]
MEFTRNGANHQLSWASYSSSAADWLQMNFMSPKLIVAIETKGRPDTSDGLQFVKTYKAQYSTDGVNWTPIDNGRVFQANTDVINKVRNDLYSNVIATSVRILPQTWNTWASMKLDVLFQDLYIDCSSSSSSLAYAFNWTPFPAILIALVFYALY